MSKICYNPIKGCDDVIASLIPGENKFSIANLRGLLEEKEGVQYVTDLMMNPKTPLKEQYKGKLIFAQSGTGKTSIADNVNVIDSDYIMAALLGVDTPLAMDAFNLLNKKEKIKFSKLYDLAIKTLVKQGRTVITGRLKSLADADVIIYNNSVSETNRRTEALDRTNKYKNTKYQEDSFRQIEAVAKTTTKEVVKLGDDKFLKDVLLTDTDFNMPVRRLKEYSALEELAIDFFNHFGISLQEFNEDGFSINHVERIINLKDSGQITPAMGETIAYMMQYNAKLKELIAEMAVEKGVIAKEKMYHKDGNINDRSYKKLDRSLFIKVIGKMIADELKYLYEYAKTNDSFDNRESKSTVLSRIKDIIKEFFNKLVKNERFIKDALDYATYVAINTLSKNNALIKASLLKPGDEKSGRTLQVNLDKALTDNPYEKDLILNLSKEGFYLGGSAGMAVQGAIFRPEENPLHDIDFVAGERNKEDLDKMLPKIVGNVEHVRTIKNEVNGEIATTETYITFTTPFEIRRLDGFSAYSVVEKATGEVIGTFTGSNLTMTEYANNNNIKGKFLDFFTEHTPLYPPVSYNFEGKTLLFTDSRASFHAKLNTYNARLKDVWDYNRYKPFGFKDNVLSNIKPVATTIKPGVSELFESNPELANEVYEALGFGKESNLIDFQEEPTTGYRQRTIKNASADATIALAVDFNSAGEKLTKTSVLNQNKKYIPIDLNNSDTVDVENIVKALNSVNAKTLNIAGNGIYTMKGKGDWTQEQLDNYVYELLQDIFNSPNLKNKIESIRTGGQTGLDEAGAKAGIKLGIPTIVLAPKGWTFRDITGKDISNEQLFKSRFKTTSTQPTPQQKQQAQQLYSQYLETIFPNSKVKDIVYHGTRGYNKITGKELPKFEKFDKIFIGKGQGLRSDDMAKGFYFGSYKIADRVGTRIIPAILNIKEENNTTVRRNTEDFDTKGDVFVVFEPEQIHILGSKQDVQGFKKFVGDSNNTSLEQTLPVETNNIVNITVDELASKIIDFKNSLLKKATKIASKVITPVLAYKKLKESFSQEERATRVKAIATIFSDVLDALEEEYTQFSRTQLLRGVDTEDGVIGGVKQILNEVYGMFNEELIDAKIEKDTEKIEKIQKVFDNWGPLLVFVEAEINKNEDIKLGLDLSFVDDANSSNRVQQEESTKFLVEESRREQWQEESDTRSAFGSIPKLVRKILGRIPVYVNGEELVDDLGFPIMQDRMKVHQTLMNLLRNRRSESHMMEILKGNVDQMEWLTPIIEELEASDDVRTKFYVSLKRAFQPYSMLNYKLQNGIYKFTTPILNKTKIDSAYNKFLTHLTFGKIKNEKLIIYKKGKNNKNYIIPERVLKLLKFINNNGTSEDNIFKNSSKKSKKEFLKTVLDSLNIPYDNDTLNIIASKNKEYKEIEKNINAISNYGLNLTKAQIEGRSLLTYEDLLKSKRKGVEDIDDIGILEKNIKNITSILAQNSENLQLEGRALFHGTNFMSDVLPSFMSDLIEDIKSFGEAGDKQALKDFITSKYLKSPYYNANGQTLNTWIDELINEDINDPNSFVNNIDFNRSLGNTHKEFKNFSKQEQYLQLLNNFFSERQIHNRGEVLYISREAFDNNLKSGTLNPKTRYNINHTNKVMVSLHGREGVVWTEQTRDDYAFYHTFVLGDSGISKFMKARRYGSLEILENMYNVVIQEKRRMLLSKEFNKDLKNKGFKENENLENNENRFTFLTFLNSDYLNGKYANMVDDVWSKDSVKKAITQYLKDSTENFKKTLDKNGILKVENGRYVYLDLEVKINPEDGTSNLDKVISEYYWNSVFATIQLVQMLSIDPAFSSGSKDFLKRFKQVNASGDPLNVDAVDPDNENGSGKYSDTGYERVIYFDDISLNVEDYDPDFAEAIAYQFGRVEAYFNKKTDLSKEEIIKLGKKTPFYKPYLKNTLTDGQGYRIFSSYRNVMGMAGKWNDEMKIAYKRINEIRSSIPRNQNATAEQIKELSELQVIFLPTKPFFFGFEEYVMDNGETMIIPVQHKYAEAILIPELLPAGSKLRDIAYFMEDNKIDMVGSTKIVKMGDFGSADIEYRTNDKREYVDSEGNVIPDGKQNPEFKSKAVKVTTSEDLELSLLKGYVHNLSYKDYRLQSNVPEHINASNLFGTQIRKHIMKGVKKIKNYGDYVDGNLVNLGLNRGKQKLSGENLIKFYNALISANILESYKSFENTALDEKRISKILSQMTLNNDRESNDNLLAFELDESGDFTLPFGEPGIEHDTSSLLLSWFKKTVNKQSIKGGSLVQVSAMGIDGYSEDGNLKYIVDKNNNIIEVETEIPWGLKYTDVTGAVKDLDFNKYCNEDGTLKLSDIEDTEGKFHSFKKENGKSYIPLLEIDYPNMTSLVAYRIPTENSYSMINLRVVRFSHKTLGGTIKVPPQGTTIAGFDFDIDKLYLMRYEFQLKPLTLDLIGDIWNKIYEENPEIKTKLKEARKDADFTNNIVKSLKSIFYNSEILDGVTNIEEERKRLHQYWEDAGLEGSAEQLFSEYLERNSDKYNNLDVYDYNKTPSQNSRVVRNNMIVQLIQSRLKDIETFKDRYTPGGFINASIAAKKMRFLLFGDDSLDRQNLNNRSREYDFNNIENNVDNYTDPEPDYEIIKPETMVEYTILNNLAGDLIGIFANHNVSNSIASLIETFMLKKPIIFGSLESSDVIDGNQNEKGRNLLTKFVRLKNGRIIDTALSLAEFLSASVDAVKDPVLNFMNLNTITADSGAVLARLGYSMEDIGLLFNQPIIKELCETHITNNAYDINLTIADINDKYTKILSDNKLKINNTINYDNLTQNKLAYNIVYARQNESDEVLTDFTYINNLLDILKMFQNIWDVANTVSGFVRNTKFTAGNAVSSTIGGMYQQLSNFDNYLLSVNTKNSPVIIAINDKLTKPFINTDFNTDSENYLDLIIDNPFSYEQVMADTFKAFLKNVISKYYPYENVNYNLIRNHLREVSKNNILNEDTINSIHRDIVAYRLSQIENSPFNGLSLITYMDNGKEKTISKSEYFTNVFPEVLFSRIQTDETLANNPLFKYLEFETIENPITKKNDIKISFLNIGGLGAEAIETIKNGWVDLINTPSDVNKDIPYFLYLYGFHNSAFEYGHQSVLHLAPTEIKVTMSAGTQYNGDKYSYVDVIRELRTEGNLGIHEKFIRLYIANHTDNKTFVESPVGKYKSKFKMKMYEGGHINDTVVIDDLLDNAGDNLNPFVRKFNKTSGAITVTPVIEIDGNYYMAETLDDEGFNTLKGEVTYRRFQPYNTQNNGIKYMNINYLKYTSQSEKNIADDPKISEVTELGENLTPDLKKEISEQKTNEQKVIEALQYAKQLQPYKELFSQLDIVEMFIKELSQDELETFLNEAIEEVKNLIDPETNNPIC